MKTAILVTGLLLFATHSFSQAEKTVTSKSNHTTASVKKTPAGTASPSDASASSHSSPKNKISSKSVASKDSKVASTATASKMSKKTEPSSADNKSEEKQAAEKSSAKNQADENDGTKEASQSAVAAAKQVADSSSSTEDKKEETGEKVKEKETAGIPEPVISHFNMANSAASKVSWRKSNGNWTAKYMLGDTWLTSSYAANGIRLDTRVEIPLTDPNLIPPGVSDYMKKSHSGFEKITRIEVPGKSETYLLARENGESVTVDSTGKPVQK